MRPKRIAAIDIGTVTTRLLIADAVPDESIARGIRIEDVAKETRITHLGEGLAKSGYLSVEAIARVTSALSDYVELVKTHGADELRVYATSASRDAKNSAEFFEAVHELGLFPELISGDFEAELSFAGASYGREIKNLLVCDPGGGSTEFIFKESPESEIFARSIDIGARRLSDMFVEHDPVLESEYAAMSAYIDEQIAPYFESLPKAPEELIGVAGTATTMVTIKFKMEHYDKDFVQGQIVSREELEAIAKDLASKSLKERQAIVGLEPDRAHVAPAGGLILSRIMHFSGLDKMTISDNDVLYGIILNAAT